MPSVLSIEKINLNGSILTAQNNSLYIDGQQVKNVSGVQVSENFFIKGYAPVSFYSRWPARGPYLNETLLNDFFMATGYAISCAYPATGSQSLQGRFYSRNLNSVIDSETIANFELPSREVYIQKPISKKIYPNHILGLDIVTAPNEMKSISYHLLGYFPAASHFDRMPRTFNFYNKGQLNTGNNIYEEYCQHDATFTGLIIQCGNSGAGPTTYKQEITGYISGYLNELPIYIPQNQGVILQTCDPCYQQPNMSDWSGYFINGKKYNFPTGLNFSGFSGLGNNFSQSSGFDYSGFKLSQNENIIFSGYKPDKYTAGELLETIGWRVAPYPEVISGFLSGYRTSGGSFISLNNISGSGVSDFPLDPTGYIIGSSGYFISGQAYFFRDMMPRKQKVIGFLSGFVSSEGIFTPYHVTNPFTSGSSGYFISRQYFFPTGRFFSGFSGMPGFLNNVTGYGFVYSGFSFPEGSGFSGTQFPTSGSGIMTGFIGTGVVIPDTRFTAFSGMYGFEEYMGYQYSGIFSDVQNNFFSGQYPDSSGGNTGILIGKIGYRNVPTRQEVSGFIKANTIYDFSFSTSGYNYTGQNISGVSGYFIDNLQIRFLTGINDTDLGTKGFDNFNNQSGFDNFGYMYDGFFKKASGFSGIGQPYLYQEIVTGFVSGFLSGTNNTFILYTGFSGSSGYILDNNKYHFLPLKLKSGQNISGFQSGFVDISTEQFVPYTYPNSSSGYFINNTRYFFATGTGINDSFRGFDGLSGFDASIGYSYTGFGIFNSINNYNQTPRLQKVIGYISGLQDTFNRFTGFQLLNTVSGSSGYFINGRRYVFPTNNMSGFSGLSNFFYEQLGFAYTGFSFPEGSGFSGTTAQTYTRGIMTGFIGYRMLPSGSGAITGIIGSRNISQSSGNFNGFNGLSGFSAITGFQYIVNQDTFNYNNENFISDNGTDGPGIITGNIGWRNVLRYDRTYGTGIFTGIIGYRNVPKMIPLSGSLYYKDRYGNKYSFFPFSINSGEMYNEYFGYNIGFFITGKNRVGFDIYNTLSGLEDVNIVMEGYYN
jgi:hypothetical protein